MSLLSSSYGFGMIHEKIHSDNPRDCWTAPAEAGPEIPYVCT